MYGYKIIHSSQIVHLFGLFKDSHEYLTVSLEGKGHLELQKS
jgi:hypothetical protein